MRIATVRLVVLVSPATSGLDSWLHQSLAPCAHIKSIKIVSNKEHRAPSWSTSDHEMFMYYAYFNSVRDSKAAMQLLNREHRLQHPHKGTLLVDCFYSPVCTEVMML